jgi:hypothetical protein
LHLVGSLSSPYVHDARSQGPKRSVTLFDNNATNTNSGIVFARHRTRRD